MNQRSKPHQDILDQLVGKTGVRVLLVEGEDDLGFFELLLNKKAGANWANDWAIGHANGKERVISILKLEPTWIGVVDRDEWSDARIQSQLQDTPNLFVLPRYCMENYFVNPDELWSALPPEKQSDIPGGKVGLETEIQAPLDDWIRHGALWMAVNPLWEELKGLGFNKGLLDLQVAQDEQTIRSTLGQWHTHLEPDRIYSQFEVLLQNAQRATPYEKYSVKIHGKKFFSEHVVPTLNSFFGQNSVAGWLTVLRKRYPLPPDLDTLWTNMGV